jgi:hypothetical protein
MEKQPHEERFIIPKRNLYTVFRKYFPDYPHIYGVIPIFL